jgi:hypothetical protein
MPEIWKDALPDIEDMRKLLEAAPDESESNKASKGTVERPSIGHLH